MGDDFKEKLKRFLKEPLNLIFGLVASCLILAALRFCGLDIDKAFDSALEFISGRTAAHERMVRAAAPFAP